MRTEDEARRQFSILGSYKNYYDLYYVTLQ